MIRRRQEEEELCTAKQLLQTAYNENDLMPAYRGIMFQMVSLAEDIEILTLQFDARMDEITDYSVEVFITDSDFESKLNDETQWTLLAKTEASIDPSRRGLVIPQTDFKSIKLKRGQRRTIYIAMNGPWLDITAQALDKTGEIQIQEQDLALYVGVGLNERFPSDFDKTVDPQFAGVIHYRKPVSCSEALYDTPVDLGFMSSQSEDPIFVARLNKSLDDIIKDSMLKSHPFSDMTKQYNLNMAQPSQISKHLFTDNKCPDEWESCPRNVLAPRVFFEHTSGLDSGLLKFEIYRFTQALTDLLRLRLNTPEIIYAGMIPVVSDYELVLRGIPMEETFTENNREYLESASTDFLSSTTSERDNLVQVLDTRIETHERIEDGGRRQLRGLATRGTLRVEGSVMGVQASYLPMTNFPIALHESVMGSENDFIDTIKLGAAVLPDGEESPTAIEYFGRIDGLEASFNADIVELGEFDNFSSRSFDATVLITICVVVFILAVIGKLTWECVQRCRASKFRLKREKMIQQKKIEKELRAVKREERKEERKAIPMEVSIPLDDGGKPISSKERGVRRAHSSDGLPPPSETPTRESRRRAHSTEDLEKIASDSPRRSRRPSPDEIEGLFDLGIPGQSRSPSPPTESTASPRLATTKCVRSSSENMLSPKAPNRNSKRSASCKEVNRSCIESPIQETRRSISGENIFPNRVPSSPKSRGGRRPKSGENVHTTSQSPRRSHSDRSGLKSSKSSSSLGNCDSSRGDSRNFTVSRSKSGDTFARSSGVGSKVDQSSRRVDRHRSASVARTVSTASGSNLTSSTGLVTQVNTAGHDSLSSLESRDSGNRRKISSERQPPGRKESSDSFIPPIRQSRHETSRSTKAVDPPAAVQHTESSHCRRPSDFLSRSETSNHSRTPSMFSRNDDTSSRSRRSTLFSRNEDTSSRNRRPSFFASLYGLTPLTQQDPSAHSRQPSMRSQRDDISNHSRSNHSRSNHSRSNLSHSNHSRSSQSRSRHGHSKQSRASLREPALDNRRPPSPRRSSQFGYFRRSVDNDDSSTSDQSFYAEPSRSRR